MSTACGERLTDLSDGAGGRACLPAHLMSASLIGRLVIKRFQTIHDSGDRDRSRARALGRVCGTPPTTRCTPACPRRPIFLASFRP
jgi:hypothetical protein